MNSLHCSPGEAQRELPEEVLQPKEEPGPRTASNQTVRPSDPGGIVEHTHVICNMDLTFMIECPPFSNAASFTVF